jgi:nucleotide-binding universal stress UspA family protein
MTTRRIVLGLDGSDGSQAALEWCREHAGILDAEVIAVGVIDLVPLIGLPPTGRPLLEDSCREMSVALETWVVPLRAADVACRTIVKKGNPAAMLDEVARDEGSNLIVVGRRGRGGFAEMLLGSVPHALAHHACCPLLVVPLAERDRK